MNGVMNLSNRTLSKEEISLLSRGLKFCPTPPCPDQGQRREDLEALHRRMRLLSHFEDQDDDDNLNESTANDPLDGNLLSLTPFKHNKFKVKSSWRGPVGPTNLEAFIASNERDYNHRPNYTPPSKQNLSPS